MGTLLIKRGRHQPVVRPSRYLQYALAVRVLLLLPPMGLAFNIVASSSDTNRQFFHSLFSREKPSTASRLSPLQASDEQNGQGTAESVVGTVTILVPSPTDSAVSKFISSPPLSFKDAADEISSKVGQISNNVIHVSVCTVLAASATSPEDIDKTRELAADADVLIGLGLSLPYDVRFLSTLFRERRMADGEGNKGRRCQFSLDCGKVFAPICGPYDEANPTFMVRIPWSDEAMGRTTMYEMMGLFQRWTVDEFAEALLLFFDRFYEGSVPLKY